MTHGLTYLLGGQGRHVWIIVRRLPMKAAITKDKIVMFEKENN